MIDDFHKAQNSFAGMIQTDSPYFNPNSTRLEDAVGRVSCVQTMPSAIAEAAVMSLVGSDDSRAVFLSIDANCMVGVDGKGIEELDYRENHPNGSSRCLGL